tara:strand:- start:222 stop:491 length:270 start_codon:yes stop_codon:yes gene_type:complete
LPVYEEDSSSSWEEESSEYSSEDEKILQFLVSAVPEDPPSDADSYDGVADTQVHKKDYEYLELEDDRLFKPIVCWYSFGHPLRVPDEEP